MELPVLRQAVGEDAIPLAALDRLANPNPWSPERFQRSCSGAGAAGEFVLVLEARGRVGGFAVCLQVLDEGTLLNIAVHPDQRRRGYGRTLAEAILARLRGQGATRCVLEVRRSNTAARALYEALGFTLDGVRRNYYAGPQEREDGLLLSRRL